MNDKILTLLGFASKSGNLSFGADAVKESIKKGKAKLVLVAHNISPKSLKEISFTAEKFGVQVISVVYTIETLSHATGHKGGIISVNENGFAEAIEGGIANG